MNDPLGLTSHPGDLLECPGCGHHLVAENGFILKFKPTDFGILQCECSEYPVVAGIPVLLTGKIPGSIASTQQLCDLVRAEKHEEALLAAVTPDVINNTRTATALSPLLPGLVEHRLRNQANSAAINEWQTEFSRLASDYSSGSVVRLFKHYFSRPAAANYFTYRFGQPKHLVTVAICSLSDPAQHRFLDIGCGAGHLLRFQEQRYNTGETFGIDENFFLLWLARTRIASNSILVCCNVENGLPFVDRSFGFVLLSNFYHFLYSKRAALEEILRVTHDQSMIAFSSLRQKLVSCNTPNLALSPRGYLELLRGLKLVILPETLILERYLKKEYPDLSYSCLPSNLQDEPMLNVVLSNEDGCYVDKGKFPDWPHSAGRIAINPLYEQSPDGQNGGLNLKINWPSDQFLEENPEMLDYMPEEVKLPPLVVKALDESRVIPEMEPFLKAAVLVDLPASY